MTKTTEENSKTILYIEDNPANLKLVEQIILMKTNYSLLKAENAEDGLDMVEKFKPDLILLDINLPGMNGYEALKILLNNPETCHIPVAALSANAMEDDIKKGKESGFIEYLTKPINVRKLLSFLETHFS